MLQDITVLEFEGLVPSMFLGMILADQGAQVIIAARRKPAPFSVPISNNTMNRFKQSIFFSFENPKDKQFLKQLIKKTTIIIDPFRPGVLQRQGFGPEQIFKLNKKAVILRVSGYGQTGDMALRPGHDLNYLSVAGILPLLNTGRTKEKYQFPANYFADFVSSSLGITSVLAAVKLSQQTGVGRVVDCSLAEGCRYLSNLILEHQLDKQQQQIRYLNYKGSEWCITSARVINEDELKKVINKMMESKISYFNGNQFQISELTTLPNFQSQLKKLPNIFDSATKKTATEVTEPGKDHEQIMRKYLRITPKL